MNEIEAPALLITGGALLCMDEAGTMLPAGAGDVLVVGTRIQAIGAIAPAQRAGARVLDAEGSVVIPGFVQGHVHLCQALFRNQADDLELLDWLRQRIWPLEAAHDHKSMAASADLGIAELIAGGTTTVLDMGSVHHTEVVFERALAQGLRLTCGKAMMDTGHGVPAGLLESTISSLATSDELARVYHGAADGRLRYAFAPRFILSTTDDLLAGVRDRVGAEGLLMHTHAAENRNEVALVRERTGLGNIVSLHQRGLLGRHAVIAHAIWTSDEERQLLGSTRTGVAHCPSSNLKLGSGICDVPALVAAGVTVGLGADGAPCNNRMDAFTEMRLAALLQKPRYLASTMSAREVLAMATREGARLLGLEDEIGSIEIGKQADLAVVDLGGLHAQPVDQTDLAGALVYSACASDVRHTLVAGQVLYEDHRHLRVDPVEIARRAREALVLCRRRAGLSR